MSDGLDGLEAMIKLASGALVLGGAGACALIGRFVARAAGWHGSRRTLAIGTGSLIGLGLGTCLMMATFMETIWRPPPLIRFTVPAGSKHNWVILLEDREHGRAIGWRGQQLPFTGVSADIAVPAGGVLRVQSLERLVGNGEVNAVWQDGRRRSGFVSGSAPAGLGADRFVAYEREHGLDYDPRDDLPTGNQKEFASYLRSLEREKQSNNAQP